MKFVTIKIISNHHHICLTIYTFCSRKQCSWKFGNSFNISWKILVKSIVASFATFTFNNNLSKNTKFVGGVSEKAFRSTVLWALNISKEDIGVRLISVFLSCSKVSCI